MRVLFISESYVKTFSELQDDVLIKKVARNIWIVQETYIQPLLGTKLYKKIIADIEAGLMNEPYKSLFENYIQPITLEYAMYKSVPFIHYALTNKSIVKKGGDNNESADLGEIKYMQQEYLNSASALGAICIKHLIQGYCDGLYPEYRDNTDLDEMKPEKSVSFGCGIYLGR